MSRIGRVALCLGTALAVIGLSKMHAIANGYSWSGSFRFAWSIGYVALLCLSAYAWGLPERPRNRRGAFLAAALATASAALVVSVAQLLTGDALLPRFVVLGSAVVLVPVYALCAVLAWDSRARAGGRDRVLVVAARDEALGLDEELAQSPERDAIIVAVLTPEEATSRTEHSSRPLLEIAHRLGATVVVLSRAAQDVPDLVTQASEVHAEGVRIRTLALFYEQWLGKQPIGELERMALLFDVGELHAVGYARLKRMFDVALSIVGVLVLALVTPFIVLGNACANRGSLFYRQARVGRNGNLFEILKFRSMRSCTPADADEWTQVDDVRITPFGRLLRESHLDELPQVWNILRGDLSIVGPRPEQPQVVEELAGKIPFYSLRHLVRPGLTGWAQVKYHYASSDVETLEKLQYEFFYLRHQSLSLDIRIVLRTARSVVGREGR